MSPGKDAETCLGRWTSFYGSTPNTVCILSPIISWPWEDNLCFRKNTWRLKCMHIQGQLSSIVFLLIKHFDWEWNLALKMFASKYLSVILTYVFRMHRGVMSSRLLTSSGLLVLNVHVWWQWKILYSLLFFTNFWDI